MINREAIYAALFAKAQSITGLATVSRRLKHWSDVSPVQQPALFQAQGDPVAQVERGKPTVWLLRVDWYLYVNCGEDPKASTAPLLNEFLDNIEAALAPEVYKDEQTLGGLVQSCRIVGAVQTDEGTLGAQGVAVVPIEILAV